MGSRPDWSPDGAWNVFHDVEPEHMHRKEVSLYRVRADGTDLQRLTTPGEAITPHEGITMATRPRALSLQRLSVLTAMTMFVAACGGASMTGSPADLTPPATTVAPTADGRIVFGRITRMDDLYGQVVALHAVDPDGNNLVQLNEGESAFPAWSPDGTRIAFTLGQPDGSWQVATMAADGSDVRVLTDGPGIHEGPSWSPDGSWIAYGYSPSLPDDPDFHTVIYRMNADGSGQELLGEPDTFDVEPRISPDGSSIIFQRLSFDDDDVESVLVVRDLDSGAERVLDAAGTAVNHANWSPDGEWIVYNVAAWITGDEADEHLWRIAADGSGEPIAITDATIIEGAFKPWYSPDGSRIAFGCIGEATGGDDALCLIDADGSNFEILVDEAGVHENHFSWGAAGP